MEQKLIKILRDDLSFLTSIRAYTSFYFIRNFTGSGGFQIVLNSKYAGYFKKDYFIYLNRKKSFIIESIVEDDENKTVTVRGKDIKSILDRRITIPPVGQAYQTLTANGETLIKNLVNLNCVNPVDTTRKIPELIISVDQGRGTSMIWKSRYKSLLNEAENITTVTGLGWNIELDQVNKKLVFDVIESVDHSVDQEINARVIFSKSLKNIKNVIRSTDASSYKNYAYVAGSGEGASRQVAIFTNGDSITSFKRREIIIDASEASTTAEMNDRGKTKLTETAIVESIDMEVTNNNFAYETDWDLGDFVSVKTAQECESLQITEVREVYEVVKSIEITIGNQAKTIASKMKQISEQTTSIL